jgi:hypothetical protein
MFFCSFRFLDMPKRELPVASVREKFCSTMKLFWKQRQDGGDNGNEL